MTLFKPIIAGPAFAAALLVAAAWGAAPAWALCSKPLLPYCVDDGTLGGGFISESACRRDVEEYLAELVFYRQCLAAEAVEAEKEVERLEKLLADGAAAPQT
jgi:hypothetical protein